MILYFGVSDFQRVGMLDEFDASILMSYHYFKTKKKKSDLKNYFKTRGKDHVMIDSGAFSAKNSGVEINVYDYIKYLKEMQPKIYVGLDVIGDAEGTKKNVKIMEQAGLTPFPTFHMGEPFHYLEEMIQEYDFIGLGGMVRINRKILDVWLDKCWAIIMNNKPTLKVHGFGVTTVYLMDKYPWESVDSITYMSAVIHGNFREWLHDFRKIETTHIDKYIYDNYRDVTDKREQREIVLRNQIQQILNIQQFITERHKDKDFSYLKRNLF